MRRPARVRRPAIHYVAEAMRRFYADRNEYLGDPDFVKNPIAGLLDPAYIQKRRATIDRRSRHAERRRSARASPRQREQRNHALQRRRCRGQRRRGHLHAERRLRQRRHGARSRLPAQQRNGRFLRQTRRAEYVRPGAGQGQRDPARQTAALLDDADHPCSRTESCSWWWARPAARALSPASCR